MPTVESIRRIRVQQTSEGGAAVRADLLATADAQTKLSDAAEAASVVTETASRRTLSAAGAFDRLRASVDSNYRSQQQMERAQNLANRAFQQGATDAATYERTLGLIAARYNGVEQAAARAAQAQRQAWRDLSAEGSKVLDNIEASRKLGSLGGGGASAANENRRLRADQVKTSHSRPATSFRPSDPARTSQPSHSSRVRRSRRCSAGPAARA